MRDCIVMDLVCDRGFTRFGMDADCGSGSTVDPSRRNLVLLFGLLDRSLGAQSVKWIVKQFREGRNLFVRPIR